MKAKENRQKPKHRIPQAAAVFGPNFSVSLVTEVYITKVTKRCRIATDSEGR
jgi:hypothetical protein